MGCCGLSCQAQSKQNSIRLNVGRLAFGTGDLFGYSLSTEFDHKVKKHVLVGAEIAVENGRFEPRPSNILDAFIQVSNISLTPKISYYPFNKVVKGFNIGVGPTIGYQTKTDESSFTIMYDSNGVPYLRRSILRYTKALFVGYRISLNYDFNVWNNFLVGLRTDFSNYNNGDVNTLAALKFGYNL